ncbi:MAG TPA: hypothetical protein PKH94_01715 [Bacteroidales bacterium]|nr:hypothetical protein [Bacteroidales bacterium]
MDVSHHLHPLRHPSKCGKSVTIRISFSSGIQGWLVTDADKNSDVAVPGPYLAMEITPCQGTVQPESRRLPSQRQPGDDPDAGRMQTNKGCTVK